MDALSLFTETKSMWAVQKVSLELDVPLSTVDRTFGPVCDANAR